MQYTRRLLTLVALVLVSTTIAYGQDAQPTPVVGQGASGGDATFNVTGLQQPTQEAAPDTTSDTTTDTSLTPLTTGGDRICPAQVDYQAVPVVCSGLVTDEVCIGQGTVSASQRTENANFSFSKPGDKTRMTDLSEINLQSLATESGAWTVVAGNLTLKTNDPNLTTPAAVTMLLIGDVSVANAGETLSAASTGQATATVLGTLGINVRKSPSGSATAVYQLSPGEQVTSTGRLDNSQGRWIRITIPNNYAGVGWVIADYLSVEGDADNLPVVRENSPVLPPSTSAEQTVEFGPMQSFSMVSGVTDASCAGTPDSGLLLQTPNGIAAGSGAKLRVNGVEIVLNGTAFIQAQPTVSLRITILEGDATVTANGSTQQAQAVSTVAVAMGQNLEPTNTPTTVQVDTVKVESLPMDLLDRSFLISDAAPVASGGQGGSMTTTDTTDTTTDTSGGISSTVAQPTAMPSCVVSAGKEVRNIRASTNIEATVVGTLQADESAAVSGIERDPKFSAVYWYRVRNGYMRFDAVIASETCQALVDSVMSVPTSEQAPAVPTDLSVDPNSVCVLFAGEEPRNVRAATDSESTVVAVIPAQGAVLAFELVRDPLIPTIYWFAVESGFVRADAVVGSPGCQPLLSGVTGTAAATSTPAAEVPAPTAVPGGISLTNDGTEMCGDPNGKTVSALPKAGQIDVLAGGMWHLAGPAIVTITVEGVNAVRPDYNDIFRIVDVNGGVLVPSGAAKSLEINFQSAIDFQIRVGANASDLVLVRVKCAPATSVDAG